MNHVLKCETPFFEHILSGSKTFELRFNDRGYQTGDTLELWRTKNGNRTGYEPITKTVTYVLSGFGLQPNWVALGLSDETKER